VLDSINDPAHHWAAFRPNDRAERMALISISTSQADTGGQGVIFVWYWE